MHDIAIIRPEMRANQIRDRRATTSRVERVALRKALQTFHTLEIMATKVYACQISREPCSLNISLTAAMCNEMTHMQDFQTKIYENGLRPSRLRWMYWIVGYVLGVGSRLLGRRSVLRTGVWVETKAVRHYARLLDSVDWDAETRAMIEKDQADESGHIEHWQSLLREARSVC